MANKGYLHGYTDKEQERLRSQARFVEPFIYDFVRLEKVKRLVEVGCGVGAQTELLLKHYPDLEVTSVDISGDQLSKAEQNLKSRGLEQRVQFIQSDVAQMPFNEGTFDAAFLCWILEHVKNPAAVLEETKRILKPGGVIYCYEVQNAALFVDPYSPGILKYWSEQNDLQWTEGGHPFIGAQLGNLLKTTGYDDICHTTETMLFDARDAKLRKKGVGWFRDLILSSKNWLLEKARIDQDLILRVESEIQRLMTDQQAVVFFPFCRAKATKPKKLRPHK